MVQPLKKTILWFLKKQYCGSSNSWKWSYHWSSNPTTGHIPKRMESRVLKRYLDSHVYSGINKSQEVEATQISINRWMVENEMATHSSILACRIPWTEEPGGLQSTESQRVGYDWATSLSLSTLSWDFQLLCLLLIVFLSSQRPVTIFFLSCLFSNCITLHTVV